VALLRGRPRALLDSAAYLGALKTTRSTTKEKINCKKRQLTGPAPSGMTRGANDTT
jgi:hypothetical protein